MLMCIVALIKTLVKHTVGVQVRISAVEPCTINRNQLFLPEMNRKEMVLAHGNKLSTFAELHQNGLKVVFQISIAAIARIFQTFHTIKTCFKIANSYICYIAQCLTALNTV